MYLQSLLTKQRKEQDLILASKELNHKTREHLPAWRKPGAILVSKMQWWSGGKVVDRDQRSC